MPTTAAEQTANTTIRLAPTRRLRIGEVAREQARAVAVTRAHGWRFIAVYLSPVFRVERLRTATRRFERQTVPVGELAQVGIAAGKVVRHSAHRLRHFRGVLASED